MPSSSTESSEQRIHGHQDLQPNLRWPSVVSPFVAYPYIRWVPRLKILCIGRSCSCLENIQLVDGVLRTQETAHKTEVHQDRNFFFPSTHAFGKDSGINTSRTDQRSDKLEPKERNMTMNSEFFSS